MQDKRPHFRRFAIIWLLASVVLVLLIVFVLAPGMPPGNGTVESSDQVMDDTVLLALSAPVALGVLLCMGYCVVMFRAKPGTDTVLEGPAIQGDSRIQLWWLVVTSILVLFLATFGTVELLKDGAGGGQGPNPMVKPAGANHALQVQVIAQQWQFTYRYPSYGGVETNSLEVPAHTLVQFNVTSLDVIHSFWAYQLGVKADANPGMNNIAYVTTKNPMSFEVHCVELCGVWHGYMYNGGKVVPKADFTRWIAQQRKTFAPIAAQLPRYSKTYFPAPERRGG
jgi:cytochrome c oxidase subunit II